MSNQPSFPPDTADTAYPSARGIMECLRMLTDEATALHLGSTVDALRAAMAVCAAECEPEDAVIAAAADAVLH